MTIGQDFAGEVVDAGKTITQFAVSDRVFGFAEGTYAEYAAAPASGVIAIPNSVSFATAAALPTAGSTALQIIRDVVAAIPGMRILIHGAGGGVGSYASQIAKNLGAHVVGTGTGADLEYLRSLGVDEVIDYKRERFEDKATGVDAVVDLVGGDTFLTFVCCSQKGRGARDHGSADRWIRCEAGANSRCPGLNDAKGRRFGGTRGACRAGRT